MSKLRRLAVTPQSQPTSEINVTPLVDVVLVLLIIFMVVTPLLEKDIGVKVPETQQEEVTETPPDQLVVELAADGSLKVNTDAVSPEDYVGKLREILDQRADKTVFIAADDGAPYPALVHVLDGAKQAGALTLGMATDAPSRP